MTTPAGPPWFKRHRDDTEPAAPAGGDAEPIYDRLVAEHGDVPTAARRAAEQARQEADNALDWSELDEEQ
ncbi:hypothetical protein [Streptomyces radiopugnans]|uniref:hypothetical protein n=1 Tax=Streptomyces radiopugnans TaxID=403935 RepID=UPI003F1CA29B